MKRAGMNFDKLSEEVNENFHEYIENDLVQKDPFGPCERQG